MSFKDKVAIVTGAATGMGRSHAIAFAREGAKVVLNDVRIDPLRKTAKEMESTGADLLAIQGDVSSQTDVNRMVKDTIDKYGSVDILVNNAGAFRYAEVVELSEEDWDRMMDVNAKGVFLCSKAVVKQMIQQGRGGKIINISSVAGKTGYVLYSAYCASKFAVIGFTQSLAKEVGKYRIFVNAICPGTVYETDLAHMPGGFVESDMVVAGETDPRKMQAIYERGIPLGRVGRPEDVTRMVLFLASDKSDWITGQSINVDGGACFSF